MPAGGCFCPIPTPEVVGGVAKPAESSAIGNGPERPPFMRGNTESSEKVGFGVSAPAFPHLRQLSPHGLLIPVSVFREYVPDYPHHNSDLLHNIC